jgi:hypothetical protein
VTDEFSEFVRSNDVLSQESANSCGSSCRPEGGVPCRGFFLEPSIPSSHGVCLG